MLAVLVDGFGVLVGIPVATAAAVLTFGLYDVGVVMKKTVVYVLLVVFFVILLGILTLLVSPLAFIGSQGVGAAGDRELLVTRIVTGVAVFALVLVLTFRPMNGSPGAWSTGGARRATRRWPSSPNALATRTRPRTSCPAWPKSCGPRPAQTSHRCGSTCAEKGPRPVASSPSDTPMGAAIRGGPRRAPAVRGTPGLPQRRPRFLLGALTVSMPAAEPLSKDGEQLVIDLASQAGLVLRNVRLVEELQESCRRIVTAQDERARKLERDIHDGAQQQLVALSVKLGLAEHLASRDADKTTALLAEVKADAVGALENVRDLARGIYPPVLADHGLPAALEAQARKAAIPVHLEATARGAIPPRSRPPCTSAASRRCRTSPSTPTPTTRRPSGPFERRHHVRGRGRRPRLRARNGQRFGLTNMRDRVEAVGGSFHVSCRRVRARRSAGGFPWGHR